jgi:signal transduction histidine kinase
MSGNTDGSRAGYESARLELARLRLTGQDARAAAMRQVSETSARALGVETVAIWALAHTRSRLECLCRFHVSSGSFSGGDAVDERALPKFLAAVSERRVLAVPEALSDPRTSELAESLAAERVASLMAAPVIRDGNVAGIICYHHVGTPRIWSQAERDFAACVADMAALFLEQADRLEIEEALRDRRESELADEKMAALGRLAGSVAHDVNNVLGALGMVGVALEADERGDIRAHGSEVRRAAALGGRLVEQLFLFARQSPAPSGTVDLVALVTRIEPVLRRLVRGAPLEIDAALERALVAAEPAEMEQVVLNLCVNAAEAVAAGGTIRLELREPRLEEPLSPTAVVLSVADDGCGMDADTKAHMFEPYFSRKASGAGIGLSTVYGIVKRCGGTILVDSAPAAGTTFRIALPRASALAPAPGG